LQDDGWPHTDLLVDGRDAREAAEVRKVVSIERAREAVGRAGRRREKARGARVYVDRRKYLTSLYLNLP
jgi:hypothetical protein